MDKIGPTISVPWSVQTDYSSSLTRVARPLYPPCGGQAKHVIANEVREWCGTCNYIISIHKLSWTHVQGSAEQLLAILVSS